jgi:hypothetical protein
VTNFHPNSVSVLQSAVLHSIPFGIKLRSVLMSLSSSDSVQLTSREDTVLILRSMWLMVRLAARMAGVPLEEIQTTEAESAENSPIAACPSQDGQVPQS